MTSAKNDGHPFIAMELLEGQTLEVHASTAVRSSSNSFSTSPLRSPTRSTPPTPKASFIATSSPPIFSSPPRPGENSRLRSRQIAGERSELAVGETARTADTLAPIHSPLPARTLGTVAYMSPEQARGEESTRAPIFFLFGAVLYEMATGQASPFTGSSSIAVFDAILHQTPASPLGLNPALPPDLLRIISKCLEKDRVKRYQTSRDLADDLKRLLRQLTSGSSATVPSVQLLRRPSFVIPALLVVAVLAAASSWFLYRSSKIRLGPRASHATNHCPHRKR